METRSLSLWSGVAGIVAGAAYLAALLMPVPLIHREVILTLLVASAFPVLCIVFSYGLYKYIGVERAGTSNTLGFVFSIAGFATFLAATVVRLAVREGIREGTRSLEGPTADAVRRSMRTVDLGLDVTWDILIAVALIFSGLAMRHKSGLGPVWGYITILLAVAHLAVNAATFPRPPADWGLFEFAPVLGLLIMALAARLAILGKRSGT